MTSVVETGSRRSSATVYDSVRNDILSGHLCPGARLKLGDLRDRYGAGTNTLREVLTRLATEGLVEAVDQKGFHVVETTRQDFVDLARFRILLEVEGLKRSIDAGDLEWEGRLVAALHKLTQVEQRILDGDDDDLVAWSSYDYEFHHALISACGSNVHLRTHRTVFDQLRRYIVIECNTHGFRGQELIGEHNAIGRAALERDAKTCARLVTEHLEFYIRQSEAPGLIND